MLAVAVLASWGVAEGAPATPGLGGAATRHPGRHVGGHNTRRRAARSQPQRPGVVRGPGRSPLVPLAAPRRESRDPGRDALELRRAGRSGSDRRGDGPGPGSTARRPVGAGVGDGARGGGLVRRAGREPTAAGAGVGRTPQHRPPDRAGPGDSGAGGRRPAAGKLVAPVGTSAGRGPAGGLGVAGAGRAVCELCGAGQPSALDGCGVLVVSAAALLALPVVLLPGRWRPLGAGVLVGFLSLVAVSDLAYMRFFGTIVPVVAAAAVHQVGQIEGSITALLRGADLWLGSGGTGRDRPGAGLAATAGGGAGAPADGLRGHPSRLCGGRRAGGPDPGAGDTGQGVRRPALLPGDAGRPVGRAQRPPLRRGPHGARVAGRRTPIPGHRRRDRGLLPARSRDTTSPRVSRPGPTSSTSRWSRCRDGSWGRGSGARR